MTCRIRLHDAGRPADVAGGPCPGCGSVLEPVGNLAELVGFRATTPPDRQATGAAAVQAVALPRPETHC